MKDALTKLVKVKSIVTIVLMLVFSYLAVTGHIQSEQFLTIFTMIISFYFGVQTTKDKGDD